MKILQNDFVLAAIKYVASKRNGEIRIVAKNILSICR